MRNQFKVLTTLLASIALLMVPLPAWGVSKSDNEQTIRNATTVLQAMVSSNDIPKSVLEKADCIMMLPSVKKFAVGIGGTGGRGPLVCREGSGLSGNWRPPAMYSIGGASAGFQVGGKASDVVIAIMASGAVDKVLNGKDRKSTRLNSSHSST